MRMERGCAARALEGGGSRRSHQPGGGADRGTSARQGVLASAMLLNSVEPLASRPSLGVSSLMCKLKGGFCWISRIFQPQLTPTSDAHRARHQDWTYRCWKQKHLGHHPEITDHSSSETCICQLLGLQLKAELFWALNLAHIHPDE